MKKILRTLSWSMVMNAGLLGAAAAEGQSSQASVDPAQTRSQVRQMSLEAPRGFQTEMRNRVQSMSAQERNLYQQMNSQQTRYGNGGRYGKGSGSGSGNQHRHQHRHQHRYQQGSRQGYASGYGRGGGQGGSGRGGGRGR